jgi:ribosomal protein L35
MKTNKSYTKRVRVTKKGKVIARKAGQGHFNAKESARTKTTKRRTQTLTLSNKLKSRFLPGKAGK